MLEAGEGDEGDKSAKDPDLKDRGTIPTPSSLEIGTHGILPRNNLDNRKNDKDCNQQECKEQTAAQAPPLSSPSLSLLHHAHPKWDQRTLSAGIIGWRWRGGPLCVLGFEPSCGVVRWWFAGGEMCGAWVGGSVGRGIHDRWSRNQRGSKEILGGCSDGVAGNHKMSRC